MDHRNRATMLPRLPSGRENRQPHCTARVVSASSREISAEWIRLLNFTPFGPPSIIRSTLIPSGSQASAETIGAALFTV
jgi:hypothetical protein